MAADARTTVRELVPGQLVDSTFAVIRKDRRRTRNGSPYLALELADRAGFEARAAAAEREGKLLGFGVAAHVDACAPPGAETATVRLDEDGGITMAIGTQSGGQGHATAYAQLVAPVLGLPAADEPDEPDSFVLDSFEPESFVLDPFELEEVSDELPEVLRLSLR